MGADWPLVQDALVIAGLAVASGVGLVLGIQRLRGASKDASASPPPKSDLEERIKVLERIATDRSIDLADEIESLRRTKEAN